MPSDLIREIYANVTQPGRLVEIMSRVGAELGAESSFMFTSHSESSPEAILLSHNMCPDSISAYSDYWHQEDVWAQEAGRRSMMRRNVVVIGDELVDKVRLHRSRYYNEFGKTAGSDSMLGSILFDGSEGHADIPFTNLCWYRGAGRERFQVQEKRLLCALLPHLQTALLLQHQMQRLNLEHMLAGASAARPGLASFVLEADGRVITRNRLADTLLCGHPSFVRCVGERIIALGARSAPTIADALSQCGALEYPVQILIQEHGGARLLPAALSALPSEADTYIGSFGKPHFLLLIEVPRTDSLDYIDRAAELFGFTPSETAVAVSLVNGLTVEQIAQERNSSIATVRT